MKKPILTLGVLCCARLAAFAQEFQGWSGTNGQLKDGESWRVCEMDGNHLDFDGVLFFILYFLACESRPQTPGR